MLGSIVIIKLIINLIS